MTKSELRRARKLAVADGKPLDGDLAVPLKRKPSPANREYRHQLKMQRWAKTYDALNGRPEGYWDC